MPTIVDRPPDARAAYRAPTPESRRIEVSVVMPCLNEAETIAACIAKANAAFATGKLVGEVVIADNGSTDGSQAIAESLGARVVEVPVRGYGAACARDTTW
jgi:glycosyltransferase involved in cell wall biosynthesis